MPAIKARRDRLAMLVAALLFFQAAVGEACPFCGVVGESLAQRRDRAAWVVVGEAAAPAAADEEGSLVQRFAVLQRIASEAGAGEPPRHGDVVPARVAAPVAGTAVLFAGRRRPADGPAALDWEAIPADENVIAHVATAPATAAPAAERLAWFARRLEHPTAAVAADAFTEFGQAAYPAVRAAAGSLDADRLRLWLTEPGVDPDRRGFYGLALGMVAATDAAKTQAAVEALRVAIATPADDFRAGFDGILAGLLVAEGELGLDWLESRGLTGPTARPLDQKHLLAAVRFAAENLADSIPRRRIVAVTRALLAAPVVAADAAVDLARYEAWDAVVDVAGLWDSLGVDDPVVRRAVAGYLAACPAAEAKARLEAIRAREPERLAAALAAALLPPGR
jgi:hypothetical protein